MEWVASTLHTTSEHGISSITTTDAIQGRQDSSDTKPQNNKDKQYSQCSQNLVLTYRKIVRFTAHIHTPRLQYHFNINLSNVPRTQMLFLPASFHAFPTSTTLTTCPSQDVRKFPRFSNLHHAHHMPFAGCPQVSTLFQPPPRSPHALRRLYRGD